MACAMAKKQSLQRPPDADTTPKPKISVAIIGTGLAGLATAYLLHQDKRTRFEITLFEQVRFPIWFTCTAQDLASKSSSL